MLIYIVRAFVINLQRCDMFSFPRRKMSSATVVGNTYEISCPTNAWEQVGANVNEGPGECSYVVK